MIMKNFRSEDWVATLMGLLLVAAVIIFSALIPKLPKELSGTGM